MIGESKKAGDPFRETQENPRGLCPVRGSTEDVQRGIHLRDAGPGRRCLCLFAFVVTAQQCGRERPERDDDGLPSRRSGALWRGRLDALKPFRNDPCVGWPPSRIRCRTSSTDRPDVVFGPAEGPVGRLNTLLDACEPGRPASEDDLMYHDAEGPHVCGERCPAACRHFGRHVGRRPPAECGRGLVGLCG